MSINRAVVAFLIFVSAINFSGSAFAEGTNITAGDCSVILNNLKVNQNVTINNNCDVPSEKKIIANLFESDFKNLCVFSWPSSWLKLNNYPDIEIKVTPHPGHYFAKYDFIYSMNMRDTSLNERIFMYADSISYEEVKEQLSGGISKEDFEGLAKEREKYPGYFLQEYLWSLPSEMEAFEPTSEYEISIKSQINYEDGNSVEKGMVKIYEDRHHKFLSLVIDANPDPYPNLNEAPPLYEFSCVADKAMNRDIFSNLCKSLIEKTTTRSDFGSRGCEPGQKGWQFIPEE